MLSAHSCGTYILKFINISRVTVLFASSKEKLLLKIEFEVVSIGLWDCFKKVFKSTELRCCSEAKIAAKWNQSQLVCQRSDFFNLFRIFFTLFHTLNIMKWLKTENGICTWFWLIFVDWCLHLKFRKWHSKFRFSSDRLSAELKLWIEITIIQRKYLTIEQLKVKMSNVIGTSIFLPTWFSASVI